MRIAKYLFACAAAVFCLLPSGTAAGLPRSLNIDWKFTKASGETFPLERAAKSVEKDGRPFYAPDYDDSGWRTVSVPHPVNAEDSFDDRIVDAGEPDLYRGFMFYRKHFTLSPEEEVKKVFIEFESVRQTVYLYVNGRFAGYYEAGVAPAGFDISAFVKPGGNLVAVATDNTSSRGMKFYLKETVPGNTPGDLSGTDYQWNNKDFNPVQGGLTGNVNLYVKEPLYLTLPLYNNLKTTGSYVCATDFDLAKGRARLHVRSEVRNESKRNAELALEVTVRSAATGKEAASFHGKPVSVPAARDAGKTFATAVEPDVYADNPKPTAVNTPEVKELALEGDMAGIEFWSPDNPALYRVSIRLTDGRGGLLDSQEIVTGFRKVEFDVAKGGLLINGRPFYLKGYAQRSTNEWAVIGVANDWLNDFDASLIRDSGANFIRWMHVAPKPAAIRSHDKYGVVSVCPAGDKETDAKGRKWSQRVEAMRDSVIYFRNSPSILFWEAGNNAITPEHMREMTALRKVLDPSGGRFMGCRTLTSKEQIAEAEWVGTMIYRHDKAAKKSMTELNRHLPMLETEFKREESPRRIWDVFSPPDYAYVNKWLGRGGKKKDGFDIWDLTQEDYCVSLAGSRDGYAYFYGNRVAGGGSGFYSGAAMMVWSDSNMHGRNSGTENCRTSGKVDPVRIPKEAFHALRVFQADKPEIKILGHWNYPPLTPESYRYRDREWTGSCWKVNDTVKQRDPRSKSVYVLGSVHCAAIELFVNGRSVGVNPEPKDLFVYEFPGVDVTQSGEIRAVAKDAAGRVIAEERIETAGEPAAITLTPVTGPEGFRADGSDVMFFDVAVVDAKGRVCPLADNRIDFRLEGPGVFLGGYNSGRIGKESVIGKDHVFAECGVNRVFVRSTREAGPLTLTATSGRLKAAAAAKAVPVKVENGFAPKQQAFPAGARRFGTASAAARTRELGSGSGAVEAYRIFVDGKEVTFPAGQQPYVPDSSTGVVCRLRPVLTALAAAGAPFRWSYRTAGTMPEHLGEYSLPLLTVVAGGRTVEAANGNTELVIGSGREKNLTNFQFIAPGGELAGELAALLAYIPGVEMKTDSDAKTVVIRLERK